MKQLTLLLLYLCAFSVNLSAQDVKPTSYKQCPDNNHPHLIDLGLPSGTKWACCNVDAKSPEDYGGYYAWGETEEKEIYNDVTYRYSSGEDTDGDGWYDKNGQYQSLGSSICGTQYDVAHMKWGGSWQLPDFDQIVELLDECEYEWTTQNGVKGQKFTGPNGASIFLPAAGSRSGTDLRFSGFLGNGWSGTQCTSINCYAFYLGFGNGRAGWIANYRWGGQTVRPVAE